MAAKSKQDQYIKDKIEEAENLGIKIGPLPLGAAIKDIKITEVNGRYCATVIYQEKSDKAAKENESLEEPPHYQAKDIFS